jgi:hypothetical protein
MKMKLLLCTIIVLFPFHSVFASQIFHLEQKNGVCKWMIYNIKKEKDKKYFETDLCPDQIVWLKDKSFYYSIKSNIFWANQWIKTPTPITNIQTARQGHHPSSEVIWGVKGKYNSLYTMVIDPKIKHKRANRVDTYTYQGKKIDPDSFSGDWAEEKAAGIIKVWLKGKKEWKQQRIKLVGRYNNSHYDEDLYNNSVLSSRQIVQYNECGDANCEKLPTKSFWSLERFEKKLKFVDNGMESIGYLPLKDGKGLLFKKNFDETLRPVKPFVLCEDNCSEMTELELPKSFSDNFAMAKKGQHFLITNENRGSVASLYNFHSPKPVKSFRGPMVFWHPF